MSPLWRTIPVAFLLVSLGLAQDSKDPKDVKDTKDPKEIRDYRDDIFPKLTDESQDITRLKRMAERTYFHEDAKISYTVPEGWKEIKPQRLARRIDPRVSAVLRIEEPEKGVSASLFWIQMNPGEKLSNWVRDTSSGGEFGEEFETLKAIYGAPPKVSLPTRVKVGPWEVYRIAIAGGTEKSEPQGGVLYLFEVKAGTTSWLVRARITFPRGERTAYEPLALDVLRGYGLVPDPAGSSTSK